MLRIRFMEADKRVKPAILLCLLLVASVVFFANPQPVRADWRDDMGAFRIGILSHGDVRAAVTGVEPFRLAIEKGLGLPVEVFPAKDYAALVDASAASRIEYAVLSSTAYAAAWDRCRCIEPLVIARSGDGTPGYQEILITRQDGPASLADLKGKHIAAIRADAFGGLDFALAQMREEGLDVKKGDAVLDLFGDGEAAFSALRDGTADALVGWSSLKGDQAAGYSRGTLRRIAAQQGDTSGYKIIWQSAFIANRVHAIRQDLPGEAKTTLRDLLSAMYDSDPVAYDAVEPIFGGGFVAARQGQFDPLAALLKAPGSSDASSMAPDVSGTIADPQAATDKASTVDKADAATRAE